MDIRHSTEAWIKIVKFIDSYDIICHRSFVFLSYCIAGRKIERQKGRLVMKIMNQLLGICGFELEEAFSPEDEEALHAMEAEYEAEKKIKQQLQRDKVVLGRWNQFMIRAIVVLALLLWIPCMWQKWSVWSVFGVWLVTELLWCGVREFNKIGDFVIHELAVISGVLLAVILQSPEKVLYAFGLSCMSAVLLSNNLGLRMWQGKPVRYSENIAGLFLMLCTVITVIFYHFR